MMASLLHTLVRVPVGGAMPEETNIMLTKQNIIELVEEEDVKFIRLQFTDMTGQMRNLAVTVSKLMEALDNKVIIDGSPLKGVMCLEDCDLQLRPDLDTFTIFPWRPHSGRVARLICDLYTPDGKPLVCDPRMVLKREIARAAKLGYTFQVGPECEFFLFETDDNGKPTAVPGDDASCFDLAPLDNGENCRRDICLNLEEMGYIVESSQHEMGKGQHEIVFRHDEALATADKLITFKNVVKTLAKRNGLHATFMPKPFEEDCGSGMHLKMMLFKDGKNVFRSETDKNNLSETAYKFIAGILEYTAEMSCFTNPIVNSYKRFTPGFDAPCYISWSSRNSSLLLKIPPQPYPEEACIELRSPDPSANPYLAIAACLKAGLDGIEKDIELPPSIDVNIHELSNREKEMLGIKNLPISLNEAIKIARGSEFVTELLGKKFKDAYLNAKQEEYRSYSRTISQWELDNYFIKY